MFLSFTVPGERETPRQNLLYKVYLVDFTHLWTNRTPSPKPRHTSHFSVVQFSVPDRGDFGGRKRPTTLGSL